jgi:hypothetical protein
LSSLTREWGLIHSVLQGGKNAFRIIGRLGIESKHLGEPGSEERTVWDLFEKAKFSPSLPDESAIFHATKIVVPTTSGKCDPQFYGEIVRDWALYQDLSDKLSPILKDLEVDPIDKRDALSAVVRNTSWVKSGAVDRTNNPDSVREVRVAYERSEMLRKSGKLLGLSSPWESWDKRSLGLQDGKLVVLLGKREQGKSMITFMWADHIWRNDLLPGENILYVSMEMDPLTVKQRTFAIRNKVDYGLFRQGNLDATQRKKFMDWCEEMETRPDPTRPELIFAYSDTIKSVGDIASLVLEHKCKAVFIDGLYILGRDAKKSNWERVMSSAEDAKIILANTLRIPVVVTSQFSGSTGRDDMKADADSAGYAKAMSDYADCVLGLFSNEDMRVGQERIIQCLKGREFRPLHWRMNFNLNTMDFSEIEASDVAEEIIPAEDDEPATHAKKSKSGGRKKFRGSVFGSGKELS